MVPLCSIFFYILFRNRHKVLNFTFKQQSIIVSLQLTIIPDGIKLTKMCFSLSETVKW